MKIFNFLISLTFVLLLLPQPSLATTSKANQTTVQVKQDQFKTKKPEQQKVVNINNADAKEIAEVLSGIGLKKAMAIVDYRNNYGKFKSIDELASVKGIGVNTLNKNQSLILLK